MSKELPKIQWQPASDSRIDKYTVNDGINTTAYGVMSLPTGPNPNVLFAELRVQAILPESQLRALRSLPTEFGPDDIPSFYSLSIVRGFVDYKPNVTAEGPQLSTDPKVQAKEEPSIRVVSTPLYPIGIFSSRDQALEMGEYDYLENEKLRANEIVELEQILFAPVQERNTLPRDEVGPQRAAEIAELESVYKTRPRTRKNGKKFLSELRKGKRREAKRREQAEKDLIEIQGIISAPDPGTEPAEERAIKSIYAADAKVRADKVAERDAFEERERVNHGTQYFLDKKGTVIGTEWLGFTSDQLRDKSYQYLEVRAHAGQLTTETVFDTTLPYDINLVNVYPSDSSDVPPVVRRVSLADNNYAPGTRQALNTGLALYEQYQFENVRIVERARTTLEQTEIVGAAELAKGEDGT